MNNYFFIDLTQLLALSYHPILEGKGCLTKVAAMLANGLKLPHSGIETLFVYLLLTLFLGPLSFQHQVLIRY